MVDWASDLLVVRRHRNFTAWKGLRRGRTSRGDEACPLADRFTELVPTRRTLCGVCWLSYFVQPCLCSTTFESLRLLCGKSSKMPARPPPISCLTQKLSLDKREGQAVSQSTRCFLEVTKRLSREEFSELTQGRIRRYAIEWLECGNGRRYWGPGKESALLFYPADKHRILGLLCDIITCQREHKKDRRYRKEVDRSPYDDDESDSDLSTDEQPRGERDQTCTTTTLLIIEC